MKVKAMCNIIYGGKMYHAGDEFETDKLLDNTERVTEAGGRRETLDAEYEQEISGETNRRSTSRKCRT